MTATTQTNLTPRLNARLTHYATLAGVALAATATSLPDATAAIVYSGPLNYAVPNNINGIYLNLVTGGMGTSASTVPGYDFNPYGSGGLVFFFTANNNDSGLAQNGTSYTVLQPFDYIGPFSTFLASNTAAASSAFRAGETGGYLGLKFLNEATTVMDYGWVSINTTAATGFPATITGYAYENTGAALPAGVGPNGLVVPEPSTTAALGFGMLSLGAAGVRRWRKARKPAVA